MEPTQNTPHPITAGFGLAATLAILFNFVLIWIKETNPSIKAAMKALLGHHWITHGVAVVLVFIVCGLIFSSIVVFYRVRVATLTLLLLVSTVLAGFGIAGFFFFA